MTDIRENQPMLDLNDGRRMPQFGFGTYKIADDVVADAVRAAIDDGYRLIDTAHIYHNERGVGEGLKGHDDIFVTTKVWNTEQGAQKARAALEESLRKMNRDSVDLVLIHWPCPAQGLYLETWETLIAMREEGKTRSIGVSNFMPEHLDDIVEKTGVAPVVNQIELHPWFQQPDVVAANERHGIVTQCWSPLARGDNFDEPVLVDIARTHDADVGAVILAWELARGFSTIPKAGSEKHRRGNLAALDISLAADEIAAIDALDQQEAGRTGESPYVNSDGSLR